MINFMFWSLYPRKETSHCWPNHPDASIRFGLGLYQGRVYIHSCPPRLCRPPIQWRMGFVSLCVKRPERESIPPLPYTSLRRGVRHKVTFYMSRLWLETVVTQMSGVSLYNYDFNCSVFNRRALNERLKDCWWNRLVEARVIAESDGVVIPHVL
jgi:hypothetical protein